MMCLVLLSMGATGTWWTWGLLGAPGVLSSLCAVLMHRYGYSLACAYEKLWQETGLRSGKCCWQAVCSPRTTGWATSCSSSFANNVLLTVFSIPPWTPAWHLFFNDNVFLPPSCIHYFFPLPFLLSLAITPNLLLQHLPDILFPGAALPFPLPRAALLVLLCDSDHQWLVIEDGELKDPWFAT